MFVVQSRVPKSKKFGGVKKAAGGKTPAAVSASPKKVGGVKTPPRGAVGSTVESCPQNCPGEFVRGMWIHSLDCPWVAVIWKFHGGEIAEWRCLYDCDPITLPSGWTHPYDCPYWNETGKTPFDHVPPPIHDTPIQSAMESTQLGRMVDRALYDKRSTIHKSNSVKQQKNRIRRGESSTVNTESLMEGLRDFEKFPQALEPKDDGLPF